MPDNQQPDSQILLQFGPGVIPGAGRECVTWPNYCTPVSAANIWQFYDARDGLDLAPWFVGVPLDDIPTPGPAFAWSASWSNGTIQGQGSDPARPGLPVHMNTNGVLECVATGLPGWMGTRIIDCFFGMQTYPWAPETANALAKGRYRATASIDEKLLYVPDDPGSVVTLVAEVPAFLNYIAAIDGDKPPVVCFLSWVNTARSKNSA